MMQEAEKKFQQALKSRRKKVKAAERKRFFRPQTKTLEKEYARAIKRILDPIWKAVELLRPALTARVDADIDMIAAALRQIKSVGMVAASDAMVDRVVRLHANRTKDLNKRLFDAFTIKVTGQTFFIDETFTIPQVKAFVSQNVSLIKDIPNQALNRIEGIVYADFRDGASVKSTMEKLYSEIGKDESRAELIARDQIAKLNAELTQERQGQVGIETYIWRTVGDERVRESHDVMNGMLCMWNDATIYSDDDGETWQARSSIGGYEGHPGTDYQCRCYAEPIIPIP